MVREPARDAVELKASLKFTHNEVDNINKSLHEKSDVLDDVVKRIKIVAPVQHDIENLRTAAKSREPEPLQQHAN